MKRGVDIIHATLLSDAPNTLFVSQGIRTK